jgi:hypothetical protein
MADSGELKRSGEARLPLAELVKLFGASLGQEKSTEAIHSACKALGLRTDAYTLDETMRILDRLSGTVGLVGTVARFAKARVILKFSEL